MAASPRPVSGQTERGTTRSPLRTFLRTETGSAALLLMATLAALAWANAAPVHYAGFWQTRLSAQFGTHVLSLALRDWVNSGLMTLFFFVIGLETRREFDMGELRERKRLALPLAAGAGRGWGRRTASPTSPSPWTRTETTCAGRERRR